MSVQDDERGAELRQIFFDSARELLQSLNEEALKLEKRADDLEAVRTVRRIVHTLKGDAAACGFRELSELAHRLEDAFAVEGLPAQGSLAEIAFAAADVFDAMLSAYEHQGALPSTESLSKLLAGVAGSTQPGKPGNKQSRGRPGAKITWTEYENLAIESSLQQKKHVYHITAQIDPLCAMPIAARQLLINALTASGEILGARPQEGSTQKISQLEFLLASQKTADAISTTCRIPSVVANVTVTPIKGLRRTKKAIAVAEPNAGEIASSMDESKADASSAPTPAATTSDLETPTAPSAPENILRVDAGRVDSVLNLVGELIIGKSMLQQVLNEFSLQHPKDPARGRFADVIAFQSRVLNDLQRSVMKVRMVPVEQLFRRLPRMVRDVAKQCGRDVHLLVSGEETDLDKSILDAIAEPMTHLVRNAVSHGIESPEERTRAGKPPRGTIRLRAYHQGNQVIVEVTDDGNGIDAQRLASKAFERGIVTKEELAAMSEQEILQLVFRPGFSTAEQITEVAGRGVGLDVVQSVMRRLKGSVDIETRRGLGTTFRLKLPLTLAIIKALMFRVEQRLYAISLNSVAEIARARESDIHRVDNCEVLQMRNQVLSLVRLGRGPALELDQDKRIFVLVMALGERKLGLIVNALEGEEELVIKALDDQTVDTDLVTGASILGDGRVVLILNTTAILERFGKSISRQTGGLAEGLLLSHAERAQALLSSPEVRP